MFSFFFDHKNQQTESTLFSPTHGNPNNSMTDTRPRKLAESTFLLTDTWQSKRDEDRHTVSKAGFSFFFYRHTVRNKDKRTTPDTRALFKCQTIKKYKYPKHTDTRRLFSLRIEKKIQYRDIILRYQNRIRSACVRRAELQLYYPTKLAK